MTYERETVQDPSARQRESKERGCERRGCETDKSNLERINQVNQHNVRIVVGFGWPTLGVRKLGGDAKWA